MPSFSSSTEKPEKDDVTVRSIDAYATLWSQYLTDASGSMVLFLFLGPFFFTQFFVTVFSSPHLILITKPSLLAVQLPSTAKNKPDNPVAYTCESQYESRFNHPLFRVLRVLTLGRYALKAYLKRERIAYVVCDESESQIDSDAYLIAEDDDSLRPYVLFR